MNWRSKGQGGPSSSSPVRVILPMQTKFPLDATNGANFVAATCLISGGSAWSICTSNTRSQAPFHSSGRLSKSSALHSILGSLCIWDAHSSAVEERSNAVTSLPVRARLAASSPRPKRAQG